jgi:hypothetical protein
MLIRRHYAATPLRDTPPAIIDAMPLRYAMSTRLPYCAIDAADAGYADDAIASIAAAGCYATGHCHYFHWRYIIFAMPPRCERLFRHTAADDADCFSLRRRDARPLFRR